LRSSRINGFPSNFASRSPILRFLKPPPTEGQNEKVKDERRKSDKSIETEANSLGCPTTGISPTALPAKSSAQEKHLPIIK